MARRATRSASPLLLEAQVASIELEAAARRCGIPRAGMRLQSSEEVEVAHTALQSALQVAQEAAFSAALRLPLAQVPQL